MTTARQLIRWSVPGSVLIVAWIVGVKVFDKVALNESIDLELTLGATAAAVGASIPIGFSIYQLYYVVYEHGLPLVSLAARDRAAFVVANLSSSARERLLTPLYPSDLSFDLVDGMRSSRFLYRHPKRCKWREKAAYGSEMRRRMSMIRAVLVARDDPTLADLHQEFTTLSDIFHGLGASRWSCVLAVPAIAFSRFGEASAAGLKGIVGLALVFVGCAVAFLVLHVARAGAWESGTWTLVFGLNQHAAGVESAGPEGALHSR